MKYAYLRVSSTDQNLDRQFDWLRSIAPDIDRCNVYYDRYTGRKTDRPSYQKLKSVVCAGDEVYIKELDRLGRVKIETKAEVQWFKERGVRLRIANIPTTMLEFEGQAWILDMVNNIILEVLAATAEQEWVTRKERQAEGIAAAKARGKEFGRPKLGVDLEVFSEILQKTKKGEIKIKYACEQLGISKTSWYNLSREIANV